MEKVKQGNRARIGLMSWLWVTEKGAVQMKWRWRLATRAPQESLRRRGAILLWYTTLTVEEEELIFLPFPKSVIIECTLEF